MASNETRSTMPSRRLWERIKRGEAFGEARLAFALFVIFIVVNVVLNPARFSPSALGTTLGMMAPLILSSIAVTPVMLAGGGGIDISVGPLLALTNVIMVQVFVVRLGLTSPVVIIPVALGVGLLSGLLNGFLAAVVRIQPIVATLGTFLIYSGLAVWIMPSPGGFAPAWLASLSGSASFVPIVVVLIGWWGLTRSLFYEHLMATGGDDRAAYTSGVHVTAVRLGAYVLTGLITAVAALSLTALIGSGDPKVGPGYTMTAIASAALGGVGLGGGVGGVVGAALGAVDIFLLQSILTFFNISPFALQIAYGLILVVALSLNALQAKALSRRQKAG
jgi:ribose transport system permease protein